MARQYHVFYIYPYGNEPRHETFGSAKDIEAFYKKVKDAEAENYPIARGLTIIYGEEVAFEPVKVVDAWRIKDENN